MGFLNKGLSWQRVVVLVLVCMIVCIMWPSAAFARSYEVTHVSILGQGYADGSFVITENRTLKFDGTYHAVDWFIPSDNSSGMEVLHVGEADASGNLIIEYPFATSEAPGTWSELRWSSNKTRISANFEKTDTEVTFQICYRIDGALKAWTDTAELNWQAIGPETDVPSKDVSVTIELPIPQGESLRLGDNVRAWVDGPLDGYIDQEDDTIVLTCPRVAAGQYLSVLASFPVEWLSDVTPQTEERLDTIMDMGAEVANTANEARATARLINYGSTGVAGVLSLGSILFAALKFRKYGKEHKAVFSDEYWRDMPSDDHPAVIGSLYRWGALADEDLAATLMKLTHEGVVKLDRVYVTKTGLLGREGTKEDYMLTLDQEKFENLTNKIDIAAVKLLFKTVSAGRQAKGGLTEASYADSRGVLALDKNHICFSEVASCAKEDAEQYKKRFDKWKKSIADAAESKNFYEPEGEAWHNRFIGVGIVMFVLAILVLVFTFDVFPIWVSIILFVASITVFVLGINMRRRSREANEIHAKTEALRRWLLDFTNLKEAIPQDVVLWDKLLVMATVLGVSQEVVDQLRVSAPYILESPEVAPIYMWYYPWGNMNMASTALAETTSEANMLSSQALAATADSSVGGGSGGFGGGGFGGSFGGGSFGGGGFGAR